MDTSTRSSLEMVATILAKATMYGSTQGLDPKVAAYTIIYNQKLPDGANLDFNEEEARLVKRLGEKNLETDKVNQAVYLALTKG